MATKKLQGLILSDGEPFRVNGATFVIDGGDLVTLEHYEQSRGRPKPLCALCDTNKPVRVCDECSKRLRESMRVVS